MSPYRGFKSFVVGLAVLMTCTDAKGVVVPAEDNYTDEVALIREASFESDTKPEEQPENMVTQPALVYYLERARNHNRQPNDLFSNRSYPRSPLTAWPMSALMDEMNDETSEKPNGRQSSSSLTRGVAMLRRRVAALAAGIDDEIPLDEIGFRKGACVGDFGRRHGPRCRSTHANSDDKFEQNVKRREFVVDLGKRFNNFRADLGKIFFNGRQKIH